MKYCCDSHKLRWLSALVACFLLLLSVGLLVHCCIISRDLISEGLFGLIAFIMYISFAGLIGIFAVLFYAIELREYQILPGGICVRYLKRFSVMIPWPEIKEVVICNVHYNSRGPQFYETVIRCSLRYEKHGPASGSWKWQAYEYSTFHFRTVLWVTYTDERLAEFLQYTVLDVLDYRNDRRYIRW